MKREMDLVRAILIRIEQEEGGYAPPQVEVEGFTEEQVDYHIYLMGQAGLLEVSDVTTMGSSSPQAIPLNITWSGHEFLENAREEGRWLKAKQLLKGAGEGSFHVWQSVLTQLVLKNVGL